MLNLSDPMWKGLEGGYGRPVDVSTLLSSLETGDRKTAWADLWRELYHQGDVGVGSYAAVPHLVRIHQAHGQSDWNTYALVASIELARGQGRNPEVPGWAQESYDSALQELALMGLTELPRSSTNKEVVRSILSILAIVFGARIYGRVLLDLEEDEVAELLDE
jgi:hypothetical protein